MPALLRGQEGHRSGVASYGLILGGIYHLSVDSRVQVDLASLPKVQLSMVFRSALSIVGCYENRNVFVP